MSSTLAYTKFELLQLSRLWMILVMLSFLPVVGMMLFVIPVLGDDRVAAVQGTASMCLLLVLIICSAQYGMGIADERVKPWGAYVRTLPGGPVPKILSTILISVILVTFASLPLIGMAAATTEARVSFVELLLGLAALNLGVIPFGLLMITIGYTVHPSIGSVLTTLIPLVLAFLGGYFNEPGGEMGLVGTVAPYVPTRGPAELLWAATGDYSPNPLSLVMTVVWCVVFGALALHAYRVDEGRRFR